MSHGYHQVEMPLVYGLSHYFGCVMHDMLFRGDIHGHDNLPRTGPCIVAGNHASYLDPAAVGIHIPRTIRVIARKTLWKPGFVSWWLDRMLVVPVDRDGGSDVKAIKAMLHEIKHNRPIGIFPEGTRSLDGNLLPAKPGAGMFACRTGVPVVPVRIFGAYDALGRSGKLRLFTPVSLVFGKPLLPADYDDPSKGQDRYQHASNIIMAAIAQLKLPAPPVI